MEDTTKMEPEWRKYAPPDAELVDLEIASDLRHNGVYLLSPTPLPSPRSKHHRGLLGKDNMFRPINARHVYGILPDWTAQQDGPEPTGQIFSNTPVREAILLDLQGFPNDIAAPTAALRLRPITPWGTYFRECFLTAASEEALLQVLRIDVAASPMLKEAVDKPENGGFGKVQVRSLAFASLLQEAAKMGDGDVAPALPGQSHSKGTLEVGEKPHDVATAPSGEDDGKEMPGVEKEPHDKEKVSFDGNLL